MIEKKLSEHIIMVICIFGFLNKNNFISQNYWSFSETTVMGLGKILWKFEHDQIIFLEFTGIESLKYKEIRVSGAKLFLRSIYDVWWPYVTISGGIWLIIHCMLNTMDRSSSLPVPWARLRYSKSTSKTDQPNHKWYGHDINLKYYYGKDREKIHLYFTYFYHIKVDYS